MHTSWALLLELGIILVALSMLGSLARRLTVPPIPLYLLAGLALGEGGVAAVPEARGFIQAGASIGLVLLLLTLGLEFSAAEFAASARRHVPSAVVDLAANATPGAVAGLIIGLDWVGVLALAGATWVSSSGIVARLLTDLRRLGNRETPAVLSVLVIEDFAMAVYLPLLAVFASGGTWWQALVGVVVAMGSVIVAFAGARRWGRHVNRMLATPDPEQLMLRVLGATLVVAALAELVDVSAAIGAFLVGLTLTGDVAVGTRNVLTPLRDLFAAVFFLSIGLTVRPAELLTTLPAALALAVVGIGTKMLTGWFAARRDGAAPRGRLRAGTALIARGEFSVVIIGLAGLTYPALASLVITYVLIVAIAGPVLARWFPVPARPPARPTVDGQYQTGVGRVPKRHVEEG